MDACLIDSLVEQKVKGQKIGGNFTKAAYRATSMAVSKAFSIICDPAHVKNRVRTLKKHLAVMKDLIESKSGFGYNESNKMIEAEPQVWAEYIKSKPLANQYRFSPAPNYEKLNELFG
ncbi:PREDICTED: uncharacterized protein LOC105961486 [Erythranthe guttata]|uniref:uncharacterized protein LOC105961486 n=1 Tax=Erythranthe guttata TaxID=4155 RepID=UPI00064DE7D9|nr:PREDICTED: uncharacterized protein LOC105961486 [Erythranthe guttata]|eukprot:XP_012841172.1 PREDICTED: uncharacterized protein LOC105961486 [Erythranthe guttata]